MTDWAAFAGIALAVLALLLVLARLSVGVADGPSITRADVRWLDALRDGADHLDTSEGTVPPSASTSAGAGTDGAAYSPGLLAVNVALSQGLFAVVLLGGIFWTGVPASALGVSSATAGVGALAVGVGFGLALSAVNTVGGAVAGAYGYDPGADLRELLTPESATGWVLLLGVALPVVAGFEELMFRGVLVGAFAAGFGLSPWLLAVLSSVAFALGHGAQGPAGIAVTGLLGFVLAAGYVLTGSLLVVVVAHYLVNAVEFVGHAVLDVEPLAE